MSEPTPTALRARYAPARGEPAWLRRLRDDAIAQFEAQGFPTSRLEDWKYTAAPARAIARAELDPAASRPSLAGPARALASEVGELEGRLGSLADPKRDAFVALNTAFFDDGAAVVVPRDTALDAPARVRFEAGAGMSSPRLWIDAEPGSRGVVVVDFASAAAGSAHFTNALLELRLGANASLDVVLLQCEGDLALHVLRAFAQLERDARLRVHTLSLGGALVRNDVEVVLAGEGAEAELLGLFVGAGERHVDNHTLVDHAVPHCTSRELYKGVLGDAARGVFRGRVLVRPGARKTSAEQHNPNLLLSSRAEIDTKPQLEIYNDDVRCSHGSTIGRLDRDALFFLRSRGLSLESAYRMLVEAFASEVAEELPDVALGAESLADLARARIAASLAPLAAFAARAGDGGAP